MLKKIKNNNELLFAVLVNVVFILIYNLMFYPRFHSDLDILMQSSIYGVSGIVSSYILYSNILIGKSLTILGSILPNMPWYIIFHFVLIFSALIIVTYVMVKRNKSLTGKVLAVVTVAFVGYECYVEPNYMKTSVLLCVCAAYLLYYAYEMNAKNKIIGVVFFAVLSSMICFSAFIISAIAGFGIVGLYCLIRGCAKEWKIVIAVTLMCIIILVAGARIFDTAMYTRNNREVSLNYRDSVEKLFGYGVPEYSNEMMDAYGLDELHYNSISQGLFFSQGTNQLEIVKGISEEKQEFSLDSIINFFRTIPIALFKTGMMYYLVVLCAVAFVTGNKKEIILATIGMLLVEYFVFYLFNACEYEWICFIIMLPVSLLLLVESNKFEIKDSKSLIAYVMALGVILYLNFSSTMVTSVREEGTEELYMQAQPEYIHIVDMVEYLRAGSVYHVYDHVSIPGNVFLMNGAYGLMDEFAYWTQLQAPEEDVEYNWLYNPTKVKTESLFLEE